jgi:hypothetical protein
MLLSTTTARDTSFRVREAAILLRRFQVNNGEANFVICPA